MRYLSWKSEEVEKERIKIDLKDRKILWLLGQNARTPLNAIAKKVGLSRDSVSYRLKRLEEGKVIQGTRALINASFFGYTPYHLFIRLKNPTQTSEREIISKLKILPNVRAILKFYGAYDLQVAVIAKSIEEFDKILQEIIDATQEHLEEYELLIISKYLRAGAFHKGFFNQEKERELKQIKKLRQAQELDSKDLELIKLLGRDARISLLDISKKLKTSPDTISYRLKKLEVDVISGYTPVISYAHLGYAMSAILLTLQNLDQIKEDKLKHFCQTYPTVLWAVKTVGKYNVMMYVCTQNQEELQKTITHLRNLFPEQIKNYQSLLGVAEYSYTYAPEILFRDHDNP